LADDKTAGEECQREEVRKLASRVELVADPDIERLLPSKRACVVEVHERNGRVLKSRMDYAKGEPANPMSFDEVARKFLELTEQALTRSRADAIIDAVSRLEQMRDVNDLTVVL
jgi:2-methylcitrate dehydratase PrpD